jgi:hypothetical protein
MQKEFPPPLKAQKRSEYLFVAVASTIRPLDNTHCCCQVRVKLER